MIWINKIKARIFSPIFSHNSREVIIINKDYINCGEMPLGLGMALSKNLPAMEQFAKMSSLEKTNFIKGCKQVNSKNEMQNYVNSLVKTF